MRTAGQQDRRVRAVDGQVPLYRSLFLKLFLIFLTTSVVTVALSSLLFVVIFQTVIRHYVPGDRQGAVYGMVWGEMALVVLLVIGAAALVAYMTARYISDPINEVVDAIQQAARGDAAASLLANRKDEFGRLASFFNDLIRGARAAHERSERTSQVKSRFLTVAAHELRTPLTTLHWSLKLLLDGEMGELSDAQRRAVHHDYEITRRMVRFVNQLLSVARIEEGQVAIEFADVVIVRLLAEVMDELREQARASNVRLEFINQISPDQRIVADSQHLRLALSNLLDNAIAYSKPAGLVTLTLAREQDKLVISVRDRGIGIPRHEQDKIFSRFYRASNAVKVRTGGNGLGLYIARDAIQRHGGQMWFESTEDKGATFYFALPLRRGQAG